MHIGLTQSPMLGRVTINSCAENIRFFTLFSLIPTKSKWNLNSAQMHKCDRFVGDAPHFWQVRNFQWPNLAWSWMHQTFLEVRDTCVMCEIFNIKCASARQIYLGCAELTIFFCAAFRKCATLFGLEKCAAHFFRWLRNLCISLYGKKIELSPRGP